MFLLADKIFGCSYKTFSKLHVCDFAIERNKIIYR